MTKEDKQSAIKLAIECRQRGGNLDDAANHAGIDRATLYRWRKEDASFATRLHQAWTAYKLSLIESVRQRKPEFLLEKQFPQDFGKASQDNTITGKLHLEVSNEDLAERLFRLFNQRYSMASSR